MNERKKWLNVRITGAPDKRLRAVLGPQGLVVKLLGIPDRLEEKLGNLHRVGSWACTVVFKGSSAWVRQMRHVVGAVEVGSIPAANEITRVSKQS